MRTTSLIIRAGDEDDDAVIVAVDVGVAVDAMVIAADGDAVPDVDDAVGDVVLVGETDGLSDGVLVEGGDVAIGDDADAVLVAEVDGDTVADVEDDGKGVAVVVAVPGSVHDGVESIVALADSVETELPDGLVELSGDDMNVATGCVDVIVLVRVAVIVVVMVNVAVGVAIVVRVILLDALDKLELEDAVPVINADSDASEVTVAKLEAVIVGVLLPVPVPVAVAVAVAVSEPVEVIVADTDDGDDGCTALLEADVAEDVIVKVDDGVMDVEGAG